MPLYSAQIELSIHKAQFPFGKSIFVRESTGNDTTGDGSPGAPYKNPSKAIAELRSGFGDRVIWINEASTAAAPYRDASFITVTLKNNWGLFGINSPVLGSPAGRSTSLALGALTVVNGSIISASLAGNGYAVGDILALHRYTENGTALVNGCWLVSTASDPVFQVQKLVSIDTSAQPHTQPGAAGDEPYLSGDTGNKAVLGMRATQCRDIMISGVGFGAAFNLAPSGLLIDNSSRWRVLGCTFVNALRAYILNGVAGEATLAAGVEQFGIDLLEEGCVTSGNDLGISNDPNSIGAMPRIMLDGNGTLSLRQMLFTDAPLIGTSSARPIVFYGLAPREGILISSSIVNTGSNQIAGGDPKSLYSLGHVAHGAGLHAADSERVRVEANFFPGVAGASVGISNDASTKVDREAQPFVSREAIPQFLRQAAADALLDETAASHVAAGSVGEKMSRLDAAVTTRATQSQILSDTTPFPGAHIDAAITSRAASGDVQRLHTENLQMTLFFATVDPGAPRNVPKDGISHMFVEVKAEAAADWSAPVDSYYVTFTYQSGAAKTDRAASSLTQQAAPAGTYTSVAPVAG